MKKGEEMKKKYEIIKAINKLRYKARKGLIGRYEADIGIGALQWVLKDETVHKKWFDYRLEEIKEK